ncbi:hypothetical protein J6590_097408, partial [Homalodisca vitripennis]
MCLDLFAGLLGKGIGRILYHEVKDIGSDERSFVRGSGSVNSFGEPSKVESNARSCSSLIRPMSVFRRIIKGMLVRRSLSVNTSAIATQLETTYDTVKSKITSLLASFRREKNKEETSKGTGKGADEIYRSKWFAYEAFGFLKDKNKCKETINSCTSQNASKENESQ